MRSGTGSADCGEVHFAIAVSGRTSVGIALARSLIDGFLFRVFCIPIPPSALTPLIRDKSRMREFRTYGSVRGVLGNRHPYRHSRVRSDQRPNDRHPERFPAIVRVRLRRHRWRNAQDAVPYGATHRCARVGMLLPRNPRTRARRSSLVFLNDGFEIQPVGAQTTAVRRL